MLLPEIDQAIELCDEYLTAGKARGTLFELFITRYLQILICSIYSQEVKKIVIEKVSRTKKAYIKELAKGYLTLLVKNIKTSDISYILGHFGLRYKNNFQNIIISSIDNQRAESLFNNIVIQRHISAHSSGSDMTFDELVRAYNSSHIILDILRQVLLGR